ncbi:PAS domain S-box protein [Ktedonobacter racemifer]|uniref:histidine kinase n=1 Tax=Ktedonobacter racemifer DSM 44963 TaxID=485913 RepID=D6TC68_KTERA|nr:PAS domain S-box protein [Ktedonobacter racemifer]EFH88104.1 PAS/PAC sensor signal transduction histidine kinase [Ktedonobacter racemifer DSM 44963]
MSNAKQTKRVTPGSRETLLHMLETLPDAVFVVDDTETIVYANASAQTLSRTTREEVCGTSLWCGAPHLVSPSLYQAVHKAKQTREPTEVEYVSPATNSWLHVSLSPTDEGLALFFHKNLEPPHFQDALSRNEQMYRDLLESFSDGVTIVTPDGLVLDINQRPLADAHLRREQVVGTPLTDLPAWSSDLVVQEHLRAAIARARQGEIVRFEARIHPRTDLSLDILMTITAHRDASQQIEYLICAGRDITERKHAEDELRVLIDAIPQLVWMARPDGSREYSNRRWCDSTDMTAEQYQGDGWLQAIHPDDQQRILEVWQRAVQTDRPYETELRLRHGTTGAYRWFLVRAMPYKDDQGTILKWFGTCTDIEEQKRAEQKLKESEENWRVLAETVPQLVWTTSPDGSVEYWNQRWYDYSGSSPEHALGHGWSQFLHPDDLEHTLTVWHHALASGEAYEIEYRLRDDQTGAYRWFLARGTPVRDEAGQIVKWFGTCTDIHDKKQAEAELRVLIDAIPQFVWIAGPDGSITYNNQRLIDFLAMTHEQAEGAGWMAGVHPDDRQRVWEAWQTSIETGVPYEVEHRLQDGTSGAYRWFLVRGVPQRNAQGTILHWVGTCTDIHDKKQAEEELRALIDAIPQLVWTGRPDGYRDSFNQRWRDYTGLSTEGAQGEGWLQCLHPEDRQRVLSVWQRAVQTGGVYEIELRLRHGTTGEYRWFLARAMPVRNESGQILKWFGTSTDIEEQKRAEQQLKESEENWRVLAETLPQFVWTMFPNGRLDYLNQRWCDYTGFTPEHMQSDRWAHLQFIHPDDREGNRALWQQTLETGEPFESKHRLRNGQTGAYRWVLARAMPVRDETGQIVKWFGTGTDIEDQKRMEEALRQSQERASVLMNSNIIGIFLAEGDQIVDANDSFLRMTGYTREDLRTGNMSWIRMTSPDYLARTRQAQQELDTQQYLEPYEKEYLCKDGSCFPVLVGSVAFQHNSRQCISFVLDNSARKELEQRKDDFISMASHELRNPLAALKMQTQLVRKRLEKQSHHEAATALFRMEGPVKQLERLIGELLDVSKIQAGKLEYRQETVDLDALLHEVADTMQQLSTTHAIVVRGAAPSSLVGDKDRLGQVFTNLISNAIKYSPGAEMVEMDLDASPETAIIRVHDHGLGIPQEQCDKIFERFYRATGPKQKAIPGLGMGLYIVAEIVKRHGGAITVDSEVGKGSTFTVTLPCKCDA